MRRYVTFGAVGAVLLALVLLLRPMACGGGAPPPPDTVGRASPLLPEETASSAGAARPTATTSSAAPRKIDPPLESVEQQIVTLTNEERKRAGLAPLAFEAFLTGAARKHSTDMLVRGFTDHVNPDGLTPADRVALESRRMVGSTGENIASFTNAKRDNLARDIVAGWMTSPLHRENILRPEYTHIGVGVVPAGTELRATQVFARIVALTDSPVPASLRRGETLYVTAVAASPSLRCDRLDVFSAESGLTVLGPMPAGDVKMSVPAAVYKLRFYCGAPGGTSGAIFAGPRIEVKE